MVHGSTPLHIYDLVIPHYGLQLPRFKAPLPFYTRFPTRIYVPHSYRFRFGPVTFFGGWLDGSRTSSTYRTRFAGRTDVQFIRFPCHCYLLPTPHCNHHPTHYSPTLVNSPRFDGITLPVLQFRRLLHTVPVRTDGRKGHCSTHGSPTLPPLPVDYGCCWFPVLFGLDHLLPCSYPHPHACCPRPAVIARAFLPLPCSPTPDSTPPSPRFPDEGDMTDG